MKKLFIISLIISIIPALAFAAEEINITTYYPIPYAGHRILRLFPVSRPASCIEGDLYYDSGATASRGLYYCDQSVSWNRIQAGAGSYWTLNTEPEPDYLHDVDASDVANSRKRRVGIGTANPDLKLTLDNDGGIIAKGTFGAGVMLSADTSDSSLETWGDKFIWYPRKAAFRAGYVSGSQWNDSNIGNYSVGLSHDTEASGAASIALGSGPTASNNYAIATGWISTASGERSLAMGSYVSATNTASFVIGEGAGTALLTNNIANSLMVGFNSTVPTLFVGSANVGIGGITNPVYKLEVNGNAAKSVGGSEWVVTSDIRIKTDIQDIDNGLGIINRLRPIKFRYTKEYKENHPSIKDRYYFSFIAQEFQKVFPDSVEEGKDGYLMMDASAVTPYLAAAVKEINQTLERLSIKNQRLKQRLKALKAK